MKNLSRIRKIFNLCAAVPEGRAAIDIIFRKKIPVRLRGDRVMGAADGHFSPSWLFGLIPRNISLKASETDATLATVLFHECRHAFQWAAGCQRAGRNTDLEDAIWHNLVREADAEATAVVTALKLKTAGLPDAFESMKLTDYGPMCLVAESLYQKNPTFIDTPEFKRMVFDMWFTIDDAREYYAQDHIEQNIEAGPLAFLIMYKKLALADVTRIGTCAGEDVNYLTLPGFKPLDDPYYKPALSSIKM